MNAQEGGTMRSTSDFGSQLRSAIDDAAAAVEVAGDSTRAVGSFVASVRRRRRIRHLIAATAALPVVLVAGVLVAAGGSGEPRSVLFSQGESTVSVADATQAATEIPVPLTDLREPTVVVGSTSALVWGGAHVGDPIVEPGGADSMLTGVNESGFGGLLDLAAGTWSAVTGGPLRPRTQTAATWTGHEFFLAGGTTHLTGDTLLQDAAFFNPTTASWRTAEPLPEPRAAASVAVAGSWIAIGGGVTPLTSNAPNLLIGNGTEPWASIPLEHPVQGVVAVGEVFVAFGFVPERPGVMSFTAVDAVTHKVTDLPGLVISGEGQPVSEFLIGADLGSLLVLGSADESVVLASLDLSRSLDAWSADQSVDVDRPLRAMQAGPGVLGRLVPGNPTLAASPQGFATVDSSDVQTIGDSAGEGCAANTTSGVGIDRAVLWVDGACPSGFGVFVGSVSDRR